MTRSFHQPSHVRVLREAPDDTKVRLLAAFVDALPYPLTRREAETAVFGNTTYSATWAASALRSLKEDGYVERHPRHDRKYRATPLGVQMLAFVRACEPDTSNHPSGGAA